MWFKVTKFISGLVITFFPFGFDTPFNEIMTGLGALIIVSAGIDVKFFSRGVSVKGAD